MAKFAKASKQAQKAVMANLCLGSPRHGNSRSGSIHSVGTARVYKSSLTRVAE